MYQSIPSYFQIPTLQMPAGAQMGLLYSFSALSLATALWAVQRSISERSWNAVLYAVGGGLTCFLEPILARLSHSTHAQEGQITAFEALGVLVPWHAAISYTFYFGLTYILLVPAFKERRFTSKQIWLILTSMTVSAWIFEAPFIHLGLWEYFGDQPYQPFHLQPVWWSAASAVMLVVPATMLARFDRHLQGWQKILIIPIAPMGAIAGAAAVSWPTWIALSSPAGPALQYLAATLTILLCVLAVWLTLPLIAKAET